MAEEFLSLSDADRKDALGVAAAATGRPAPILEKDVLVVWALDAVTGASFGSDLVFKGGTSLSKVHGAIRRFSEDLDLTYDVRAFASDLVDTDGRPLKTNTSQMKKWNESIRDRLETWTKDTALPVILEKAASTELKATIEALKDTIVIKYEPIFASKGYLPPTIRLEFGARSTGEPNDLHEVVCDAAAHVSGVVFPTARTRVMKLERTFWEKATAIHVWCLQQKPGKDRFSRHWSDLSQLEEAGMASAAIADREIATSVCNDKNLLWREKAASGEIIDYLQAVGGELRLVPDKDAIRILEDDYEAMIADGYFPEHPGSFEALMERCSTIEQKINGSEKT